jgi:hypothetical protein
MINAPNDGKVPMIADGGPTFPTYSARVVDHRVVVGHFGCNGLRIR